MSHNKKPTLPDPGSLEPLSTDERLAILEWQTLASEHRRVEWLRNIWFWCVCALLVMATIIVAIAIVSVAWHYLAPNQWGVWLEPDQLRDVRTFLFSGAITGAIGFIGAYVKNRISPDSGLRRE